MSMLTAQCDGLRETADEVERIKHNNADWLWRDGITLTDAARELRDAADTIENLRNRLTETCHDVGFAPYFFECSECGKTHLRNAAYVDMPNYCPECGRKVVG
jgi:rubrerythrin